MIHKSIQSNYLTLISRIFDPFVVLPLTVVYVVFASSLKLQSKLTLLSLIILIMVAPPVLLLKWAVRTRKIKNWDMSDRKQRPQALFMIFLLGFINIFIVRVFGDRNLLNIFILFQIYQLGFLLITFFWKISGHAANMAFATGILIKMHGFAWWPILLLVPFICVVRVLRHDHTPVQVIMGALYSFAVIYLVAQLGIQ